MDLYVVRGLWTISVCRGESRRVAAGPETCPEFGPGTSGPRDLSQALIYAPRGVLLTDKSASAPPAPSPLRVPGWHEPRRDSVTRLF